MRAFKFSSHPLTRFRYSNIVAVEILDLTLLKEVAGSLPDTSDEGIDRTVAWLIAPGEN